MSKIMTMKEAVSTYVKSGDCLFIGGMQHGEPSAALHEIIRQKIDHLYLVITLVTTSNLIIGEGLVDRLAYAYIFKDVERYYHLGKARKMNRLPVFEEYSHYGISSALLAGQMGIPFMPIKSQLGSDLYKINPNLNVVTDPYSGKKVGAVKAIVPDVGIIHVQRCDTDGNAQRWGTMGVDAEGINASRKVIITTEKIVDSDVIRRDPNRTIIPGFRVSAVVEVPWGAYPMHLAGCYTNDMRGFYAETLDPEGYETYVKRLIYGVNDWNEYLKERTLMKGENYFKKLRVEAVPSEPVYSGYREAQNG